MPIIKEINGKKPKIGKDVFIAENAVIIGDVEIADGCSIWYNVVIRGDVNFIRIGRNTNIQDGTVIHATYKKSSTIIGNNVSVGHRAIIHACKINDNVLVGMGAIIMDNAEIGEYSVIAAGSLVTAGKVIESNSVYAGLPAKKIKDLPENLKQVIDKTATNYQMYKKWYEL